MKRLVIVLLYCLFVGYSFQAYSQSIPLGQPINTGSNDEYNPCISGNGKTMLFEQLYFNESKPTVQISYMKSGSWTRPETLNGANSDIPTISNGGFFVNYNGNIVLFHSARYGGIGGNDIWMIEKTIIGTWSVPKNLAKPINTAGSEVDPSMSPDGKYLYFTRQDATKTPEGTPCGKIYMSERLGKDTWKAPVLMPSPINKNCECAGRMLNDNKTFVFASMRDGGMGGYDIYKTKQNIDGSWEEPVPYSIINTSKDDCYVSVPTNGTLIYHTTPGKTGGLDIGRTMIPENLQSEKITMLQGTVRNETNNLLIVPKVVVTNIATNKATIYTGGLDGTYTASVPQDGNYDVAIMANDGKFSFKSMIFKTPSISKFEEKNIDVKLKPTIPNALFVASNISFVENTDTLDAFSLVEVNRIYSMLKANLTMKIEIGVHSHTADVSPDMKPLYTGVIVDTLGTMVDSTHKTVYELKYTYTTDNTKNQAKTLQSMLIKKGIPTERVVPVGYGNRQPLSPPPADKTLNRRVEIKIIDE